MSEFSRVFGHRQQPQAGILRAPTTAERDWVARMAPVRTSVPKGVFRYQTMQQANSEWERWQAEAITGKSRR